MTGGGAERGEHGDRSPSGGQVDLPANASVARFLPARAREEPSGLAVLAPCGRRADGAIRYREQTFAQLDAGSDATAAILAGRGVTRGTRVLLMVKPGLDLIRITFALFKMGAVPVVIDPGMGLRAFLGCVRRSRPEALVGVPLAAGLSRVFRGAFRGLRVRVTAGTGAFERSVQEEVGRGGRPAPAAVGAADLAAVLFTSGSTGPPKGVCYAHGMFDAQVRLIRDRYGIEAGEVDLPMLPLFALFNPALGMTTVVPEMNPSRPATVDPEKIVRAVRQCGVTNSFGSPVLWSKIGRYCTAAGIQLPGLRRVLMAGAPVPPSLIRAFHEILPNGTVHTPYGATECLPVSSISGPEVLGETWARTEEGKGTCVGAPVPGIRARIIPVDDGPVERFHPGACLPPGEVGEIVVTGPVVTVEYDGLEEATRRAKVAGPDGTVWHRMGDLGYLDDDGRLWFCGRLAERVTTAAGDLYTDCCEAVFNRHPDVFRTALIGLGPAGSRRPALVVEPVTGKFPASSAARRRLRDELAALGAEQEHTRAIDTFFFDRRFPVDVRHNAKIHRLTLARKFDKR